MVRDGCEVLSSVISSQIDQHSPYGGVVPEIASRSHVEALPSVVAAAVRNAGVGWDGLDAVAVTCGPGLASSLMAGLIAARALAYRIGKPLLGLNHLEAHIYSVFLDRAAPPPSEIAPLLFLTVSGGHTNLVLMRGLHDYEMLGTTLDDAAGEALDKGAKLLGLGYPGGPAIEKTSKGGRADYIRFPRGVSSATNGNLANGLNPKMCFSFSGVKTSLLYYTKKHPEVFSNPSVFRDVACSYQAAIIDAMIRRVRFAVGLHKVNALACAGGVARNTLLRDSMTLLAGETGIPLYLAPNEYCTDNAAMVAGLGGALDMAGIETSPAFDVEPRMPLA